MLAGTGVHVYVLDTGIRKTHAEFQQGGHSRTGVGFDAVTLGGTADDCHSHGTHVAAIIGGTVQTCMQQLQCGLSVDSIMQWIEGLPACQ